MQATKTEKERVEENVKFFAVLIIMMAERSGKEGLEVARAKTMIPPEFSQETYDVIEETALTLGKLTKKDDRLFAS